MVPIFFTKLFQPLSLFELATLAQGYGVAGFDLAVRAGHPVNPDNVATALPEALALWRSEGLTVPLVTLETGATNPADEATRRIFETCGEWGVPFIKLGYWTWQSGASYWEGVDAIRRDLEGFAKLAEATGVVALHHNHSDNCYGSNACGSMLLVKDFDPTLIGVYLDPGHLAVDGEWVPMALAAVKDYLRIVAVKNVRWLPEAPSYRLPGTSPQWRPDWCQLEEGIVNWPEVIGFVKEAGFEGPINFHGEYSNLQEVAAVKAALGRDLAYLLPHLG